MKKFITIILGICVIIFFCFQNKANGQNEIKLIATIGTFSVSPKQGHIPMEFSSLHTLRVDSNSFVVLNMPNEVSSNELYMIIGPSGVFHLSNPKTDAIVSSNDPLIWKTEIEKLVKSEAKTVSINCSISNEELRNILEDIGFDYLPNYPDIINLDFKWSELTNSEEKDKEVSPLIGESNFTPILSDTVSVPVAEPDKVIHKEFSFLAGKWKMFINGNEAAMNLDSFNYELRGNVVFDNKEMHQLHGISFYEPFIRFNLISVINSRQQKNIPFIAKIDRSQPLKMCGIFEKKDTIHTWSAVQNE